MRNAMYGLVLALLPAAAFGVVAAMEFYKGNLEYGLVWLLAAMLPGLFAVRFGRRYKRHRNGLNKFLDQNPSVYKKYPK